MTTPNKPAPPKTPSAKTMPTGTNHNYTLPGAPSHPGQVFSPQASKSLSILAEMGINEDGLDDDFGTLEAPDNHPASQHNMPTKPQKRPGSGDSNNQETPCKKVKVDNNSPSDSDSSVVPSGKNKGEGKSSTKKKRKKEKKAKKEKKNKKDKNKKPRLPAKSDKSSSSDESGTPEPKKPAP